MGYLFEKTQKLNSYTASVRCNLQLVIFFFIHAQSKQKNHIDIKKISQKYENKKISKIRDLHHLILPLKSLLDLEKISVA